jgi:type IV pilus assembly protein PilC
MWDATPAPDGQPAKGIERAHSRSTAELALYERELRDIRVVEKKSFLHAEISGPRVKREDLMQASVLMAAFIYDAAMRPEPLPRKPLPQERPKKPAKPEKAEKAAAPRGGR